MVDEEPTADRGVAFPEVDGDRSSMATGQAVFTQAAAAIDESLARDIEHEDDWYGQYLVHARRLIESELRAGDRAAKVPQAGLAALREQMVFVRDGAEMRLEEAVRKPGDRTLHTATVRGTGETRPQRPTVPYRGDQLQGPELKRQLDRWVEAGTVESSFADAIRRVDDSPEWLDLSNTTVVMFGAASEMGPLPWLCRWGATVIAVDLPRPELWHQILADARQGTGTLHAPVPEPPRADASDDEIAATAGADLITAMPEVAEWIAGFDGPLTLGDYVYADGATNVRASMAVDAITNRLAQDREGVSLAVLATPTDVFAVPADAVEVSTGRYRDRGLHERLLGTVSGRRMYAPNYETTFDAGDATRHGVVDCIVEQQGANYILAKRVHRWRGRAVRDLGHISSINVAPPSRTKSVISNRVLAAAYDAAPRFGVEVFEPETSEALMALLLVHDLHCEDAAANPAVDLAHPLDLLIQGANHGGLWRIPFAPRSVLPLAALIGMVPGL